MVKKRKSILAGALTLTAAGLITRLLGFAYRIHMSNIIGAEGMGLYQLIMPVYSLSWSIACSGFTTTISKLVAQENAARAYGDMGRALKQALVVTGLIALAVTAVLFFGADMIGAYIIRDTRTILPIRILAIAIPFMTAGSCIRGYFLGLRETTEPAFGQVLEQCVRMAVIFAAAPLFVPRGLEYACAAAVIGIVAGEFVAFLFSFGSYLHYKRTRGLIAPPTKTPRAMLMLMLAMALPLTANRITGSFLSAWENTLIPQKLREFGLTQAEAMSAYGRITGMALPLIFFPSALLTALAVTLVPAISEATATGDHARIRATTVKAIRFTSIIGFGAAALFLVLPDELGRVIYRQELGSLLLRLGLLCPFWYVNITLGGILNGLGRQSFLFRNSLFSSFVNIAFVYLLVPQHGIDAFLLGWFLSLLFVTIVSLYKIKKTTGVVFGAVNSLWKPLLSAAAAGLASELFHNHIIARFFSGYFALAASGSILLGLYALCVLVTGCVSRAEILTMIKLRRKQAA